MNSDFASADLRDLFASTKVGDLTLRGFPILSPDQTAAIAASEMKRQRRGSTLVCDQGKLVGIYTERDWLRLLGRGDDPSALLSEVMTAQPQSVSTEATVWEAVELMDHGGYRRVPVLDASDTPVGIVDVKRIVHFIVEHIPEAVYNQASHDQLTARNREGA